MQRTVSEASLALARLDAELLEEMAVSWGARLGNEEVPGRLATGLQGGAACEFSVLRRLLDFTAANLRIMRALSDGNSQRLEYVPHSLSFDAMTESGNGHA